MLYRYCWVIFTHLVMGIVDRMVKSIYTYLGGFDMKEVFRPIKDYEG